MKLTRSVAGVMLLALTTIFGVRTCIGHPMVVDGGSMKPTLLTGDVVWMDAASVAWSAPEVGDIVVYTNDTLGTLVKRVVAVAGDTVELCGGLLTVNGVAVPTRLLGQFPDWAGAQEVLPLERLHVERHEENLGTLHLIQRHGEKYEGPFRVPADHVFVLGDNRGDSRDSRFHGPIPTSQVTGRVALIRVRAPKG